MGTLVKIILFAALVLGGIIYLIFRAPVNWRISPVNYFSSLGLPLGFGTTSNYSNYGTSTYSFGGFAPWPTFFNKSGGYLQNTLSYPSGRTYAIQGLSQNQISPYYGKVRLSGISSILGGRGQIQLFGNLSFGETVNVTGWHIKSNRGDVAVPKAINFYDYTGLAPETDIVITGNSAVYLYSGSSPISKNLRLNKCTGFLQANNQFNPALPQNCPALFNRQEIIKFAGFCQSYILSLGSCQLPDARFYNTFPPTDEGNQCREFLNQITPKKCYDLYSSDRDFLSNTWIAWVGRIDFDPQHDDLQLFDRQGLLVDRYTY